jgi:hypothetical protein
MPSRSPRESRYVAENELTPEMLAEQIRQLKIEDIVLSTVSTLGQLAYAKLDGKQIDQSRLAIDAIGALLPTLEGHADEQVLRDFKQLLANLRLSFADTVAASGSEPRTSGGAGSEHSVGDSDAAERDAAEAEPSQESTSGSEPQSPGTESRDDG